MYLDQTPMTKRNLQSIIEEGLRNSGDDDPITESHRMDDPVGLRVVTETGKIFHIVINEAP